METNTQTQIPQESTPSAEAPTNAYDQPLDYMTPYQIAKRRLQLTSAGEMIRAMRSRRREWLVRGVLVENTTAVIGASAKVGKTYCALDLAVAVAAGTPWLGRFEAGKTGRVLFYPGECGGDVMAQRLAAVCEFYNVDPDEIDIDLSEFIPNISDDLHLAIVAADVRRLKPVLVVLDSVYLAIPDVDTKNIASVGAALYPIQSICSEHGAALVLTHHWNSSGKGDGPERFSGAGWDAWGRSLISVKAGPNQGPKGTTVVDLSFKLKGSEVPEEDWAVTRVIYREDPDDLNSPIYYAVQSSSHGASKRRLNTPKRILRALDELGNATLDEILASDTAYIASPASAGEAEVKRETMERALRDLLKQGEVTEHAAPDGTVTYRRADPQASSDSSSAAKAVTANDAPD
jgi:hypothetical protein